MDYDGIVVVLMSAGANIKAMTEGGQTALMMAAENNRLNAARMLLVAGADVNAQDEFGNTSLMRQS